MKVSELIAALQKLQAEHGDLPVCIHHKYHGYDFAGEPTLAEKARLEETDDEIVAIALW